AIALLPAAQWLLLAFDPTPHLPTPRDVAAGDAVVAALRAVEGEVYAPMHGELPRLAGKRSFAHDSLLLSLLESADPSAPPAVWRDLEEALRRRRFAAVLLDSHQYRFLDTLRAHYEVAAVLPGSFRPSAPEGRQHQWL